MKNFLKYERKTIHDRADITINLDYIITIHPKNEAEPIYMHGYDMECLFNLENKNKQMENIEATLKFNLQYNLLKACKPIKHEIIEDMSSVCNEVDETNIDPLERLYDINCKLEDTGQQINSSQDEMNVSNAENEFDESNSSTLTASSVEDNELPEAESEFIQGMEFVHNKFDKTSKHLLDGLYENHCKLEDTGQQIKSIQDQINFSNTTKSQLDCIFDESNSSTLTASSVEDNELPAIESVIIQDMKFIHNKVGETSKTPLNGLYENHCKSEDIKQHMNSSQDHINFSNTTNNQLDCISEESNSSTLTASSTEDNDLPVSESESHPLIDKLKALIAEADAEIAALRPQKDLKPKQRIRKKAPKKIKPTDHHYCSSKLSNNQTNKISCNICGESFESYNTLNEHNRKITCTKCGTNFQACCEYESHKVVCYSCNICKQHFTCKDNYETHSKLTVSFCNNCNVQYENQCLLQMHKLDYIGYKKCTNCHSIYDTNNEDNYHTTDSVTCEHCYKIFSSQCSLMVHNNYCLPCTDCNLIIKHETLMRKHTEIATRGYNCCDQNFTTLCEFNNHITQQNCTRKESLSKVEHKCSICKQVFRTIFKLKLHSRQHAIIQCSKCKKSFSTRKQLNKHVYKCYNGTNSRFLCSACGLQFNSFGNLQKHMLTHSDEHPFICEICNKRFKSETGLNGHKKTHRGLRLFGCKVCNKKFSTAQSLRLHGKIHLVARQFKCTVCGKGFYRKEHMITHMYTHTLSREFKCTICAKTFARSQILKYHMKTHIEDFKYKCDKCEMSYSRAYMLRVHSYVHTKMKPFKCEICAKSFHFRALLKDHIRIHTGEKPYKCVICCKGFRMKISLTNHMRVHTGEKPFKCNMCDASFTHNSNLYSHVKKHL